MKERPTPMRDKSWVEVGLMTLSPRKTSVDVMLDLSEITRLAKDGKLKASINIQMFKAFINGKSFLHLELQAKDESVKAKEEERKNAIRENAKNRFKQGKMVFE